MPSIKLNFNGRPTSELPIKIASSETKDLVRDVRDNYSARITAIQSKIDEMALELATKFHATKYDDELQIDIVDDAKMERVPNHLIDKEWRDRMRDMSREVERIGDEFMCALMRTIIDQSKISDEALKTAIDTQPDSEFWRSQDNKAIEVVAQDFRGVNRL